jgi:hypothetical protein
MNATIKLGLSSVLLMLAGGFAAYSPAASAQVAPLKNTGNSRCLAVNAAGGAITQLCNGSAIQTWVQNNTASGFLLRNASTNRCLDSNAAGSVFTSPCNATIRTQLWRRLNTSITTARFISVGTSRYLESTVAGAVFSNPAPGGALQVWAF